MKETDCYDRAAALLPGPLRAEALFQPEEYRAQAEEIRLRSGLGAWLCLPVRTVLFHAPDGPAEIKRRCFTPREATSKQKESRVH